jgi:nucleotide-binding universal stress UspA family protein
MNLNRDITRPAVDSILHPTDFSPGSQVAFHHALKAALVARSALALLHVAPDSTHDWSDFPGVRETLERWKLLPPGSPRSAVPELGIDVSKVVMHQRDPVRAVLRYIEDHPVDMIVLATEQREGRARWLHQSVAEPVARRAGQMTLFIPGASKGFVSATDGSVSLANILVPVAAVPLPQPAVDAAARLATRLQCPQGTFTLLHVGEQGAMPALRCPEVPGWQWHSVTMSGDVTQCIVDTARRTRADLIVMTTDGRDGFLDALRGSHSEQVLRQAVAPLLAVPA